VDLSGIILHVVKLQNDLTLLKRKHAALMCFDFFEKLRFNGCPQLSCWWF